MSCGMILLNIPLMITMPFLDNDGVFPLCHPDDVGKFINYVATHDDVVSLNKYLPEDDVQASDIISFCVKSEMYRLTSHTLK